MRARDLFYALWIPDLFMEKVKEDEELWIDPAVNEYIWKRGIENPPRKITLRIERHDQPDFPIEVTLKED